MANSVLILGAKGRFGRNASEAFRNAGWSVTPFNRGTDTLDAIAQGKDVIVNAWNPAYPDWARELPILTRNVIAAAKSAGATVIFPGNVYVFGQDAPDRLAPDTPHTATNLLGRLRSDMEASYRASGVPTIILRCGDFIDTEASGNWFDKVMTKDLRKGRMVYPGAPDVPHAWAYLPDAAKAAAALAKARNALPAFADIPFPGYTLTGEEIRAALERVTGRNVTLKRMNWLPLQLARPFWPMARHLLEMRYLWTKPHYLDGECFVRAVPDFVETPLDDALASAVKDHIHPDDPVART